MAATTMTSTSPFDEAMNFLCARCFHQSLKLPATAAHGALRVTFATTRNFDDQSLPVILFCGPMFGSRSQVTSVDRLAADEGVRFIAVDRPGMGGSTRVPLDQRLQVWVEIVPAVLTKLGVKHVYLVSHSAGTLYAMQTLYYLREILAPQAPYMAFVAPWVHNEQSNATLMNIASKIPSGLLDKWSDLNRFINLRVMPITSWSGGIVGSVANLFQGESPVDASTQTPGEKYGTSEEVAKEIENLQPKMASFEEFTMPNEEAKLCMRKDGVSWGVFQDFTAFVRKLSKREIDKRSGESDHAAKLKLRVFFAESDIMIGKGGRDYFDEVWSKNTGEGIDYESYDLPGTDHDSTIIDQKKGAWLRIAKEIKALHQ